MGDITARMVGRVEQSPADGEYELMSKSGQDHLSIKFGMSGCHDTTLAGCLASVGAFSGAQWPPFTSHIAFELFRKAGTAPTAAEPAISPKATTVTAVPPKTSWWGSLFSSTTPAGMPPPGIGRKPTEELSEVEKQKLDGYYVRIRFNDEVVSIPGCKLPGKHLDGDESLCTLVSNKETAPMSLAPSMLVLVGQVLTPS